MYFTSNLDPSLRRPAVPRDRFRGCPSSQMTRRNRQSTSAGEATTPPVVRDEGIVIVDENFRLIAFDYGAKNILDIIGDRQAGSEVCGSLPRRLLDLVNGHSPQELDRLFHLKIGQDEFTCRTFVVEPHEADGVRKMLALYLKRELSVAEAVHLIGMDYRLTGREQEALIGVSMGLTSKELATRMKISPNTVKAFLRLIMIKMGVTTRAGIVGKLLDQNNRRSEGQEAREG